MQIINDNQKPATMGIALAQMTALRIGEPCAWSNEYNLIFITQ